MSKVWIPDAGELIFIDFDPQAGHEQAGRRPALVLSSASYNSSANLAIVCPITSQVKGYPFEVALPSGLKITGVILADHLKSVDWKIRKAKYVETVPRVVVEAVRQYTGLILGIK